MAEVTQGGRSIATLGRGDLVGEMALLQPYGSGRRNATVTAVTDCEIYAGSAGRVPPDPRGRPVGGREGARATIESRQDARRRLVDRLTAGPDRPRHRCRFCRRLLIGNHSVTVTNVLPVLGRPTSGLCPAEG